MKLKKSMIQEEWLDSDGYWIALKDGYGVLGEPGLHTIHEDNRRLAYKVDVSKCDCQECLRK